VSNRTIVSQNQILLFYGGGGIRKFEIRRHFGHTPHLEVDSGEKNGAAKLKVEEAVVGVAYLPRW